MLARLESSPIDCSAILVDSRVLHGHFNLIRAGWCGVGTCRSHLAEVHPSKFSPTILPYPTIFQPPWSTYTLNYSANIQCHPIYEELDARPQ